MALDQPAATPETVLLYTYTGGTTKHSKCVVVTCPGWEFESRNIMQLTNHPSSGDLQQMKTASYHQLPTLQKTTAVIFRTTNEPLLLGRQPSKEGTRGLGTSKMNHPNCREKPGLVRLIVALELAVAIRAGLLWFHPFAFCKPQGFEVATNPKGYKTLVGTNPLSSVHKLGLLIVV